MSTDEPASERKATGFTPGDDAWTRWQNTFNLLAGRMSLEGQNQYRRARDDRMEEKDCKRCEHWRDYLLAYGKDTLVAAAWERWRRSCTQNPGPVIRFMNEKINQLGGDIHSQNIQCRRCDKLQSGGFDPHLGIQICANSLRNQGHLEDTLAHGTSTPSDPAYPK